MSSNILQITGQVVGAAVGAQFGSPQLGAAIGGSLGNGLSGTSKHTFEGARLETLAVQTSTYGRMIPMVFGSVRIAGNVVWSRPIKEIASTTTTRTGGKGGVGGRRTSNASTTYSYYVTLAIAICEGEITRVNRVWADAQLLDLSQGVYRIYKGNETQLPDSLIESFEGVGSTPAYRGLAYIVIEDFPLASFGNRIPNFSFEVTRRAAQVDVAGAPVESLVKSIMLLPGSGEFVYDTQPEYKINGTNAGGNVVQSGFQIPLNLHTAEGKANVLVALDQMQETFPNLEWVGLVVNWFGTSMDIATCEIWPSVEYQAGGINTPDDWQVAGLTRASGRQIGSDGGQLRYGGTPDDGSIVRLLTELRARGLKIFLYPQLLMDVAGKPWRGFLTGNASQVSNFFTKTRGYNNYIMHYANLAAGKIDAFAIGTEMRDLTKITSGTGVFPAVSQFVSLASAVKTVLGASVKVTYAADWSEYHHTDGGWYHLDPLWASPHIDMVGIDAYFPLTDAVQTGYDIAAIRAGWTSGEGYDFYYTDSSRTTKAPLSQEYAWKNISWWWNNAHINPGGAVSAWIPQSKPIWFAEYGFASVDGTTNEPNVFVDASTTASAYPRFSRGRIDFVAQRVAIAATEAEWMNSTMVTQRFLWTWDARPYPHWPDLVDVWADGANWVTGHWVQGKLGASHVGAVVEQIARRAGLSDASIDTSQLQMQVDGFVINERVTARAAIQQLMQAYFFTMRESGNALIAILRDATVDATVDVSECIEQRAGDQSVAYIITRQEDLVLPQRQEIHFLNRLQRYEASVQSAERSSQDATETNTLRVSLVLADVHARAIAETMLADRWAERSVVTLQLPLSYATLEVGDVIQLNDGALTHRIRLTQVQIGRPGIVKLTGVLDASEGRDGYIAPTIGSNGGLVLPNPRTQLEILDLPAFPSDLQDALTLRFAAAGVSQGWRGTILVRVMPSGDDEILATIDRAATIGNALNALPAALSQQFDEAGSVDISLLGNATLANALELSVLNGTNVALLGREIIQFKNAVQQSEGIYRLSGLLRGRLGTEDAISSHTVGERFVLLDDAIVPVIVPAGNAGQSWTIRAVTYGDSLNNGVLSSFTITAESLKPLSPVMPFARRDSLSGDIALSWIRRARIDQGLRDYVDVPLMEQSELYDVEILSGGSVIRHWRVTAPFVTYDAADQLTDFGVVPLSLSVRITQISALIGPGNALISTLPVQ